MNTNLRKEHENEKQGILDVRVLLNNQTEIDIEIQLFELRVWADRSLFYLSKMYVEQIQAGQDYDTFKKCVSIRILDFKLLSDTESFYSCFHLREDTRHTLYTDKMEFHVIELPKLPQTIEENSNSLLLWAKFLDAEREEEFDVIAKQDSYIQSAYRQLQVISQDKEKRLEYEAREKAIRDYNQLMKEAKQQGKEEGREEGIKALILDNLEDGKTEIQILGKLERRFSLNSTEAKRYFDQCIKINSIMI